MKKTLIFSGALAGIILSFTPNLYAGSNNFSFSVSAYLPPAIGTVVNESQLALVQQTVTRGHDLDLFAEERVIEGQTVLIKTSVLR